MFSISESQARAEAEGQEEGALANGSPPPLAKTTQTCLGVYVQLLLRVK